MEILSDDKLQELNHAMLGLGAPVVKDDTGYNKPDYFQMEALGRYRGNLDDEMRFAIVDSLSHYKHTQLASVKDDLEYTLDYFKEKLQSDRPYYFSKDDISDNTDDFISKQIHFSRETEDKVYITFEGKVYLYDFAPYWKEYGWTDKTYKELWVSKRRLQDFIERFADFGDYGYAPDEELTEVVERVLNDLAHKEIPDTLNIVKRDYESVYISFSGYVDIKDFIHDEYENYGKKMSWVKINGNYVLRVGYDELPYLYKEATEQGFVNKDLATIYADFDYALSEPDRYAQIQNDQYGRESANTLVDVDTLNLPFVPYDFQIQDAEEIISYKSKLIGHDMGCGKTFIASLVGASINTPKIVVCPESLRLNWRKEIRNVSPDANIRILYSKEDYDITKDNAPDWLVMGYQTVVKHGKQLSQLAHATKACVFVDEAHNAKAVDNSGKPNSKRAEAILELCANAEYVYPITGTPIPTRNKDLYNIFKMLKVSQIDCIDLTRYGSFFEYGKRFCNGYENDYGWDFSGNSKSKLLHEELQSVMVRRLKSEVLPNLTKQRIFIPTETTSKEYAKVEQQLANMDDEDSYLGLAMHGRAVLSKEKAVAAIDLAESMLAEGKSVVIVSNFNETLDKIVDKFKDDCCTIRGGMTDKAKQQAIDDFQSGNKTVCALNIIAGGVGVTLTKAHDMIICDYDWTPSNMSQVEDRICRAGQTEPCQIHYIYCENAVLDKIFVGMITDKSANIDNVVDGKENSMNLRAEVSYMQLLKAWFPIKKKEDKAKTTNGKSKKVKESNGNER